MELISFVRVSLGPFCWLRSGVPPIGLFLPNCPLKQIGIRSTHVEPNPIQEEDPYLQCPPNSYAPKASQSLNSGLHSQATKSGYRPILHLSEDR